MKKIIATVLAMVMALALCTTAFAASTTTELKAKDFSLLSKDNATTTDLDKITKTVQDPTSVTDKDGKTTTTYYADKYVITAKTEGATATDYYAVDSSVDYTLKLVSGGKVVAFLLQSDTEIKATDTATAMVKTTKDDADRECGDYNVPKDTTLYTVDGKAYPVGTDKWVRYNGSFVQISNTKAGVVEHNFDTNKTSSDKGTITSVYCNNCKKYIPVVKTADISASDTAEYKAITNLPGYSYKVGAAGTTGTTTETKPSPKTFDAGIAMYVGMALTSVAGSAVVIGKKKEF